MQTKRFLYLALRAPTLFFLFTCKSEQSSGAFSERCVLEIGKRDVILFFSFFFFSLSLARSLSRFRSARFHSAATTEVFSFLFCERTLIAVSWTSRRGCWGVKRKTTYKDTAKLVKHPVRRSIDTLQVLTWSTTSHGVDSCL